MSMDAAFAAVEESHGRESSRFEQSEASSSDYKPEGTTFVAPLPESYASVYEPAAPEVPVQQAEPAPAEPALTEPESTEPELAEPESALPASEPEPASKPEPASEPEPAATETATDGHVQEAPDQTEPVRAQPDRTVAELTEPTRTPPDRPGADATDTDRPDTDRPDTDRPATDRPATDRPSVIAAAGAPIVKAGGVRRRPRIVASAAGLLVAALVGGLVGAGTVTVADRRARTVDAGLKITTVTGPPAPALDGSVTAAASKIAPSVVTVYVGTGANPSSGSGIILRSDGYILTNDDVIAPAPSAITVVLSDGRAAVADVVGRDALDDLAVLKVTGMGALTAATFANSALAPGQAVLAAGAQAGLAGSVSSGIVSALARPVRTSQGAVFSAVQTDAGADAGDAGGPLADLNGAVVGVITRAAAPAQAGVAFAITAEEASRIAGELITSGKVSHATLGATVTTVPRLDGPGVRITALVPSGPAAKAGLKLGDVIAQVGDSAISSTDALVAAVRAAVPGQRLVVRYTRLNTAHTANLVLGLAKG